MAEDRLLPEGFADLEPLLAVWDRDSDSERYTQRLQTPLPELKAFYDTIFPRMEVVMRHLSAFPGDDLAALPQDTRRLFKLALAYFEASHPIELHWKASDLDHAFPASRIVHRDIQASGSGGSA